MTTFDKPEGAVSCKPPRDTWCAYADCSRGRYSKGYCYQHYLQQWRTGELWPVLDEQDRAPVCAGVIAYVPLFTGRNLIIGYATIDIEDVDIVNGRRWATDGGYAKSGQKRMHRLIMNAPKHMEVDHINRCKLDNRRDNLRLVTHSQQQQNVPGRGKHQRGVYEVLRAHRTSYRAVVSVGGKKIHCGCFDNPQEASIAAINMRLKVMTHSVEKDER